LTGGREFAIGELIPPGPIKRPIRRGTGDVAVVTERVSRISVGILDLGDDPIEINPTAAVLRGRTIDILKSWADSRRVRQVNTVWVRGLPGVKKHTRDTFLSRLRSEFGDAPLTQPRGVLQLKGPAAD